MHEILQIILTFVLSRRGNADNKYCAHTAILLRVKIQHLCTMYIITLSGQYCLELSIVCAGHYVARVYAISHPTQMILNKQHNVPAETCTFHSYRNNKYVIL